MSANVSSYFGIRAILLQKESDEKHKPVVYIPRVMTSTEHRDAQIVKEALAIAWALDRFADFVNGQEISHADRQ